MADSTNASPDPYERLLRQYEEIAELSGSLAHEIKNPLSVIVLNMDVLAEDLDDPQTPRERRALEKAKIVQSQCERLQNLLDDFLRFARLRDLELLAGNFNDLITRVLDFFELQAKQYGIEVIRYLDPDLPSVKLNSQTMYAALMNLVKNAIESMEKGGQLVVRSRVAREGISLDLIDTGCGMGRKTLMHMFDAFYSTKESGSGLGLPMVRRIIEAHGGLIDVKSEVDRGTQFTIELPVPPRIEEK